MPSLLCVFLFALTAAGDSEMSSLHGIGAFLVLIIFCGVQLRADIVKGVMWVGKWGALCLFYPDKGFLLNHKAKRRGEEG